MAQNLPAEIVWRKKKIGFEPPQKEWMSDARIRSMIQEAKRKLVDEKILNPEVLNRPAEAHGSHEANVYDWRYLAAASYL